MQMKTELIVSITATIISLSAFGVAVWQGYVARRHNRLSVKPMLHFDFGVVKDDLILTIKNTGIGPAIIRAWTVTFNGKSIGGNSLQIANKLFEELEVEHMGGNMYFPGFNQAMAAGGSYQILKIKNINLDKEVGQRIRNDLLLFEAIFKYESIYGEKFELRGPDS